MTVWELWLPILVAGVATHIFSTLAWTVLPHHKPEMQGLNENEAGLTDLLVSSSVAPGAYLFPFPADMKGCSSEEFKQKQARCTGELVIWERPINMGAAIAKTLTFFLVTAFVIGYLASFSVPRGAEFLPVFRFATTAGLLAHCFAKFPHVFWFPKPIVMSLVDGVVYAVITGLAFGLLWPAAS